MCATLPYYADTTATTSPFFHLLKVGAHIFCGRQWLAQLQPSPAALPKKTEEDEPSPSHHQLRRRPRTHLIGITTTIIKMEAAAAKTKASIVGEVVKHTSARTKATCEISATGFAREDIDVNILSPSKVPVSYSLSETEGGLFFVEFVPQEVGTYIMDVYAAGQKIPESPVFYKVYDSSLIKVTEAGNGVVGQPCQFRVDASQAGEGQLEISINDGEVPNHVQVLGGGRCLVHFTPEVAKPHTIDIKFNGEPINGCPFVCRIADTSKVSVALHHLELFPVNEKASFQIHVDTADNAELAVSVAGPRSDLPVQVTGNIKSGFLAEFLPEEVGPYVISVEYNNVPVGGTPFTGEIRLNALRWEVNIW